MKLLSFTEVCRRVGVCDKTARKFRDQIPNPVKIGRRVMWPEDAVEAFIRRGGCTEERPAA